MVGMPCSIHHLWISVAMATLWLIQTFQFPHRAMGWASIRTFSTHRCTPPSSRRLPSIRRDVQSPIPAPTPLLHPWSRTFSKLTHSPMNMGAEEECSAPTPTELQELLENWKNHPSVNLTLRFPTLLVSSESLSQWIREPKIQQFLAKPSSADVLSSVHPRIRMVQPYNDTHKLILLRTDTFSTNDNNNSNRDNSLDPNDIREKVATLIENFNNSSGNGTEPSIAFGPQFETHITYQQLTFAYVISSLLPIPPPSGYEQIGHIAHFNLKPEHVPYGQLIGEVLRVTNPTIDTVVNKVGIVKGKYRTYDLEVLAGPANFETVVIEHGMKIYLNVSECYWNTGLSGERQELLQELCRTAQKKESPLVLADVFCGVGAVCLLLSREQPRSIIFMNDWNPHAIKYLIKSIEMNGLGSAANFDVSCKDAYEFLIELGTKPHHLIPDHVLMNYPLDAPSFLRGLRWWSGDALEEKYVECQHYPRFHVYTFAKSEKDMKNEEEVAVDIVADVILPRKDGGSLPSSHRRKELDTEFSANVQTRIVRDVAPGKVVVCVAFTLTPKLVRLIQRECIL